MSGIGGISRVGGSIDCLMYIKLSLQPQPRHGWPTFARYKLQCHTSILYPASIYDLLLNIQFIEQ